MDLIRLFPDEEAEASHPAVIFALSEPDCHRIIGCRGQKAAGETANTPAAIEAAISSTGSLPISFGAFNATTMRLRCSGSIPAGGGERAE